MNFKESKTYQNLLKAYDAELLKSTKYRIYKNIAIQNGYVEIGNIYETTANNEQEHAKIWLTQINEGNLPNTTETLKDSIEIENYNANTMYQDFAQVAREEGFIDIAALFSGVANIEYNQSANFQLMYNDVTNNTFFCKPSDTLWICLQCGNIMSGKCAPEICPVCKFPKGYYRLLNQNLFI